MLFVSGIKVQNHRSHLHNFWVSGARQTRSHESQRGGKAEVEDYGFSQALPQDASPHKTCEDLEKERQDREEEKARYLGEKLPPLQLSGIPLTNYK
ncbi:hypothetical protein F7725_021606 [Dissostichus mawsoni]|uniref:Uncharacterized protein n=1 Tax=Dissostichus mawsoni TaxID=36200 RepID=A0A7J5ZEZ3_DISMA|nr:hypothetical protein F7725_021606 [Dissostichus mawsoni]